MTSSIKEYRCQGAKLNQIGPKGLQSLKDSTSLRGKQQVDKHTIKKCNVESFWLPTEQCSGCFLAVCKDSVHAV